MMVALCIVAALALVFIGWLAYGLDRTNEAVNKLIEEKYVTTTERIEDDGSGFDIIKSITRLRHQVTDDRLANLERQLPAQRILNDTLAHDNAQLAERVAKLEAEDPKAYPAPDPAPADPTQPFLRDNAEASKEAWAITNDQVWGTPDKPTSEITVEMNIDDLRDLMGNGKRPAPKRRK
jgi:hypothetical protein